MSPQQSDPTKLDIPLVYGASLTHFAARDPNFDTEFFQASIDALRKRVEFLAPLEREALLSDWYIDSIWRNQVARFESEFVTKPAFLDPKTVAGLELGSLLSSGKGDILECRTVQYGPSLLVDVAPGTWARLDKKGDLDVLGTANLTACAVICVTTSEDLFLTHIRTINRREAEAAIEFVKSFSQGQNVIAVCASRSEKLNDSLSNFIEVLQSTIPSVKISCYDYEMKEMDRDCTGVVLTGRGMSYFGVSSKSENEFNRAVRRSTDISYVSG